MNDHAAAMSELVMVEAALFQLRAAVSALDDAFYAGQIQLSADVLAGAVERAGEGLTAAAVRDIEFALNDLAGLTSELAAVDAATLEPPILMLRDDLARLHELTSLPPALREAVGAFSARLRERRAAIERETYRDPSVRSDPLPHPPEELREAAMQLRQPLADAGFATPALDTLIADAASLRFHTIGDILDELEAMNS